VALRPRPATTSWGRAFEVSLEFSFSVLIGVFAGYYLDRWLGTEPILLFVFLALGFAAGVRNLLRLRPPDEGDSER
jgi:ATP synthase protein I